MSDITPALDGVDAADEHAGDPVAPEHDLDLDTFTEEDTDDE